MFSFFFFDKILIVFLSPIVQKCMDALQTNFDERLKQMFETMQTTILGQTMSNNTVNNGKRTSTRKSSNSISQNSSNEAIDTTVISVTRNVEK